jgi:hypothetical protein
MSHIYKSVSRNQFNLLSAYRRIPREKGSVVFCTTGVMLQRMQTDPALREISHLVLDEIHERDVISDFVITILKDIIQKVCCKCYTAL